MGMSIDEAIKQLTTYSIPCGKYKKAYDMAIETMRKYQKIEQEPILDKIRAEIKEMSGDIETISDVLQIIDKYKSEGKE